MSVDHMWLCQFLLRDSPSMFCESRSCCHFGCVTLLSVMQRGELARGSPAMAGMPLTTTVLLIMASRREARPDTDACAKTCISTGRCSQVCAHTCARNKCTSTHAHTCSLAYNGTVPHLILFSILPLSSNSRLLYDRLLP